MGKKQDIKVLGKYAEITMSLGFVTKFDTKHIDLVSRYCWYAKRNGGSYYACTEVRSNGHRTKIAMHRLVLGLTDDRRVKHVDGDTLHNCERNLSVSLTQEVTRHADHASIFIEGGHTVMFDLEDIELVSKHRWFIKESDGVLYAVTNVRGTTAMLRMHRLVVSATAGVQVDHRDGDSLNNRKLNLRSCNDHLNQGNRKKTANCSSKFKGVCWDKSRSKWVAQITTNRKHIVLGRFLDEITAARAYDAAAVEHFGEFARTNVMLYGPELV